MPDMNKLMTDQLDPIVFVNIGNLIKTESSQTFADPGFQYKFPPLKSLGKIKKNKIFQKHY